MNSEKFNFEEKEVYKKLVHFLIKNDAYVKFLYNFKRLKRFSHNNFYNPENRLPYCNDIYTDIFYLINDAFDWHHTVEGFGYWSHLANKAKNKIVY